MPFWVQLWLQNLGSCFERKTNTIKPVFETQVLRRMFWPKSQPQKVKNKETINCQLYSTCNIVREIMGLIRREACMQINLTVHRHEYEAKVTVHQSNITCLYYSSSLVRENNQIGEMEWVKVRNVYKTLAGRDCFTHLVMYEMMVNIEYNGCADVIWIQLAQNKIQWHASMNVTMKSLEFMKKLNLNSTVPSYSGIMF